MGQLQVENGKFVLNQEPEVIGDLEVELLTKDAYLDKNIFVHTTIPEGDISNTPTEGIDYYELESEQVPVLISGDYLYINKGFFEDTKIALADLVPNEATIGENSALMYKTVTAYDNNGNLIAGTMDDAQINYITDDDFPDEILDFVIRENNIAWNETSRKFDIPVYFDLDKNLKIYPLRTGYMGADFNTEAIVNTYGIKNCELPAISIGIDWDLSDNQNIYVNMNMTKSDNMHDNNVALTNKVPSNKYYLTVYPSGHPGVEVYPKVEEAGYGTPDQAYVSNGEIVVNVNEIKRYIPLTEVGYDVAIDYDNTSFEEAGISFGLEAMDSDNKLIDLTTTQPTSGRYLKLNMWGEEWDSFKIWPAVTLTLDEGYTANQEINIDLGQMKNVPSANINEPASYYIKIYDGETV